MGVMGSEGLRDRSRFAGSRAGVRGGSGPTPTMSWRPKLELVVSGSGDSACEGEKTQKTSSVSIRPEGDIPTKHVRNGNVVTTAKWRSRSALAKRR